MAELRQVHIGAQRQPDVVFLPLRAVKQDIGSHLFEYLQGCGLRHRKHLKLIGFAACDFFPLIHTAFILLRIQKIFDGLGEHNLCLSQQQPAIHIFFFKVHVKSGSYQTVILCNALLFRQGFQCRREFSEYFFCQCLVQVRDRMMNPRAFPLSFYTEARQYSRIW